MYTVFGYDWDLKDFRFSFDSFVAAVKCYRNTVSLTTAFISRGNDPNSCLFVR